MKKTRSKFAYKTLSFLAWVAKFFSVKRAKKLLSSAEKRRPRDLPPSKREIFRFHDNIVLKEGDMSTNTMDEIYARISQIEPYFSDKKVKEFCQGVNLRNNTLTDAVSISALDIIRAAKGSKKVVVFTPWIKNGGSDLVCYNMVKVLADHYGASQVLILMTDVDKVHASRLTVEGCTYLGISPYMENLDLSSQARLVETIVRNIGCVSVLNINSLACWKAYEVYGARLRKFSRIYACLFCPDYNHTGIASGYSDRFFRETAAFLDGIFFDNQKHINDLVERYRAPLDVRRRLILHPQPVDRSLVRTRSQRMRHEGRYRVIWAGRITSQKNIGTYIEVAKSMPHVDFNIYGAMDGDYARTVREAQSTLSNLYYHGAYSGFGSINIDDFDVFVYTSLWDGMPNIILEAVASGIPIVSSNVGGVAELLKFGDNKIVRDPYDVASYVGAIESIIADPNEAYEVARRTSEWMLDRHNEENYYKIMRDFPSKKESILNV